MPCCRTIGTSLFGAHSRLCRGGLYKLILWQGTPEETQQAIQKTKEASIALRRMPAPQRGELVRQIREALASKVGELGDLVSLEMGKIKSEGKGEVQEVLTSTYS
jgi:acyl-CoA reductase-like NAD-dependent aldehyde dehydrogenase